MNEKAYQSFTELELWKRARELKNEIHRLVKAFPPEEKYRLVDQIVRYSRSINANIAEGHGRYTSKEQLRFCIQARGSLSETHNHLFDALDCGYIDEEQFKCFQTKIKEVERLLNGYISFLRRKSF